MSSAHPAARQRRLRMLETVRAFVAEHLAARPDADQVGRRHAGYYRALAEQADRPLRRGAAGGQWLRRLDAEAGNLAAAVRWYLAHDPGPMPHLLRILWPLWFGLLRDLVRQGRSWVEQLLPATQITRLVSERDDLPANWGRWGEHDERGTLNLITDEVRARAVAEVRTGRTVSPSEPAGALWPALTQPSWPPGRRNYTNRAMPAHPGRPETGTDRIPKPRSRPRSPGHRRISVRRIQRSCPAAPARR